jgi:hypothetical protein
VLNLRFTLSVLLLTGLLVGPLSGCNGHATASAIEAHEDQRAQLQAELESQREQLEMISLPTKSRYMAIHSFESWQNPYLTVQPGMLELHVTLADANPSSMGVGGMLRPIGARRQVLDIGLDKLGDAISSVPKDAWPYGRVVAIEEAHKTPAAAEPAVRRNMEAAVAKLSDLGIVVYDLSDGKVQ